jgi:alkanesulfonate monooxygenase SsuD/methylene tetrahydromethanopterin reductase-like flavin-dependent oxidoreductase (luciferase family)
MVNIMEFGVQIEPQFGYTLDDVVNITNDALKNGFSTLWFSDHFMLDKESTDRILLEPWLLMTALTQLNNKIRVGSMVFCQSYRNQALTAKMAATLDVISNGRLEFGIGAGWKEIEYNTYGIPFPKPITRINQLAEAVQIIRGIWTNERFTFKGEHYQVEDVISFPKPVRDPMPIWIGAQNGKEFMLRVTAKHGDGINIAWMTTPKDLNQRFERLSQLTTKYGRDSADIKKSVGLWTRIFDSEDEMEAAILEDAKTRNVSPDEYRERVAQALWGTADQMVTKLREFKDIGVEHIIFMFPHEQEISQIKTLGKTVLSKL